MEPRQTAVLINGVSWVLELSIDCGFRYKWKPRHRCEQSLISIPGFNQNIVLNVTFTNTFPCAMCMTYEGMIWLNDQPDFLL